MGMDHSVVICTLNCLQLCNVNINIKRTAKSTAILSLQIEDELRQTPYQAKRYPGATQDSLDAGSSSKRLQLWRLQRAQGHSSQGQPRSHNGRRWKTRAVATPSPSRQPRAATRSGGVAPLPGAWMTVSPAAGFAARSAPRTLLLNLGLWESWLDTLSALSRGSPFLQLTLQPHLRC